MAVAAATAQSYMHILRPTLAAGALQFPFRVEYFIPYVDLFVDMF